jgi:eukaryotic-like serine/threonine-protein kinase
MRRFVQEAKAASALSHPNVAHIYEIGEADGVHFIVMEYVEGRPLRDKISGQSLEAGEILDLGTQIADALDEAYSKGVTHRDIKPANIMITPRGQVRVLDFGLAKVTRPHAPSPKVYCPGDSCTWNRRITQKSKC